MNAQLQARPDLTTAQTAAMFALLDRHFDGVDAGQFHHDLAEKNWVVLLVGDEGELAGFSTIDFRCEEFEGRTDSVLYSGDTIVDPSSWHANLLSRAWIEAARYLHARHGCGDLWWLLLTSGFRTYRLLSVFWSDFHPRHDRAPDDGTRRRWDAYARHRFGTCFDPSSGIVRFPVPQRLRPHLAGLPPARLDDPHVACFARLNPGHADGDELVCLARLDDANLTATGRRIVDSIRRSPVLALTESVQDPTAPGPP